MLAYMLLLHNFRPENIGDSHNFSCSTKFAIMNDFAFIINRHYVRKAIKLYAFSLGKLIGFAQVSGPL